MIVLAAQLLTSHMKLLLQYGKTIAVLLRHVVLVFDTFQEVCGLKGKAGAARGTLRLDRGHVIEKVVVAAVDVAAVLSLRLDAHGVLLVVLIVRIVIGFAPPIEWQKTLLLFDRFDHALVEIPFYFGEAKQASLTERVPVAATGANRGHWSLHLRLLCIMQQVLRLVFGEASVLVVSDAS